MRWVVAVATLCWSVYGEENQVLEKENLVLEISDLVLEKEEMV